MKFDRAITQIFPAFILLLLSFFTTPSLATPDYARQTGFECKHCHIDVIGGGPLTQEGKSFLEDMKAKGLYQPLTTTQHYIRLVIGYLHLMSAIIWFGTIMYVHVLLKPAYASKGLPKGELRLGWISMIVILVTGVLLTIARMPSWNAFYTTRFGVLLSAKIFLFLIMLSSAIIVTVYIGPRLRRTLKSPVAAIISHGITPDQLSHFDGKEGRPAYIAYKGIVYDVSHGRLWKNGSHVMKHSAGNDLTDTLKNAPHGEDKVLAMPQLGMLQMTEGKPARPFHERLFYFFAYMNLVLVFVITFIIALWRWW
ncbi:MAG TPA: CopD family protein [Nitrospirota bacterium]|nr:CopD family protein [Nitrospirota bacterium]